MELFNLPRRLFRPSTDPHETGLRKIARRFRSKHRHRQSHRPAFEQLEDRTLLATVTWINATGGDWNTAGNWDNGVGPGSTDDAVIPDLGTAGASITITHSSGSHTVASLTSSENVTLSGGTLQVNGTVSVTGTFTLSGPSELQNTTLAAGTILSVSGGALRGVTVAVNAEIIVTAGTTPRVYDGITIHGKVTVNSSSEFNPFGTQTWGGGGEIQLVGGQIRLSQNPGMTLTLGQNLLVHGRGGFGESSSAGATLRNDGTIRPDQAGFNIHSAVPNFINSSTGRLEIGVPSASLIFNGASWTNQAALTVSQGTFEINNAVGWTNLGSIHITGGTLQLGGSFTLAGLGTLTRAGGTAGIIKLSGTLTNSGLLTLDTANDGYGTWILTSGTLSGGTLETKNGAILSVSGGTLSGLTIASGSDVITTQGASPAINSGLTINQNGKVTLNGGELFANGSQTIGGSGSIVLVGNVIRLSQVPGMTLTIGQGFTIHGRGGFGENNSGSTTLLNNGIINADVAGFDIHSNVPSFINLATGSLLIGDPSARLIFNGTSWTNQAALTVSQGTFEINNAVGWTNVGNIHVSGGTLQLGGSFTLAGLGTLTRTGGTAGIIRLAGFLTNTGTLTLDTANNGYGTWILTSGTLSGGTLVTKNGAVLSVSGGTLSGLTIAAGSDVVTTQGASPAINSGLTVNGKVTLNGGDFLANGSQTFGGSGEIILVGTVVRLNQMPGMTLTIGPNLTIHGRGGFGESNSGNTTLLNNGTIAADVVASSTSMTVPNVINAATGTIQASASNAVIDVLGGTWTNSGILTAKNGGTLKLTAATVTNLASGTLTGGTWQATTSGTMRIPGAVTTNAATILVDGSASNFYRDGGTTKALTSLTSVAAAGSLTIQNGHDLSTPSDLADFGTITVGTGSTLTPGGTLTVENGATLRGNGTVAGPVVNVGSVAPGNSPGCITVDGDYSQDADGTLEIEIAGTSPGTGCDSSSQFDRLEVNGMVSLDGDLEVTFLDGFVPSEGDSLTIIENDDVVPFDPVTGEFSGLPEGSLLTVNGVNFQITYQGGSGNDVVLTTIDPACSVLVSNGDDSGAGSLRQAIIDANSAPGLDVLCFAGSVGTILLDSELPAIVYPVLLDGESHPSFSDTPVVELNGSSAGADVSGLTLAADSDGSTVRGLIITGFSANGIVIEGNSNSIARNFIGVEEFDCDGNEGAGVVIQAGASHNAIGGTTDQERNVISCNGADGVVITGSGSDHNVVRGNYLGINIRGVAAGNRNAGVRIEAGAQFNTIGGTESGAGNIIVDNGPFAGSGGCDSCTGIDIIGSDTAFNVIAGNFIGVIPDLGEGEESQGNFGGGILIDGAHDNTIGGTTEHARNVISANIEGSGILITGPTAARNVVVGNYIGTNIDGDSGRGNEFHGIEIIDAPDNRIGSDGDGVNDEEERNVISSNEMVGVLISGPDATGNVVRGNTIGTDWSGTEPLGNLDTGVRVGGGASNVVIDNNVISDNGEFASGGGGGLIPSGIDIIGPDTFGVVVTGNHIGTDVSGTNSLGNFGVGIYIEDAHDNVIGGVGPGERNVISSTESDSNFDGDGILITGSTASGNVVIGNYIGTDVFGLDAKGNEGHGVKIVDAPNNRIGTDGDGVNDEEERNVISGNDEDGVNISGSGATGNVAAGNYIGTDVTGLDALGNLGAGVRVENGASDNIIGGTLPGTGNVISGNNFFDTGIDIIGSDSSGNLIAGNLIGLGADGDTTIGNEGGGILIEDSPDNTIGGSTEAARNVISGNNGPGIIIRGSTASGNVVIGNTIGTDATGLDSRGNNGYGIKLIDAPDNRIGTDSDGTDDDAEGNVISGNNNGGVFIQGTLASGNLIAGNLIGLSADGDSVIANFGIGIRIEAAPSNTVGGSIEEARNVISANFSSGLSISGASASENVVIGNYIGTSADGMEDRGNDGHGIELLDAPNNRIGTDGDGIDDEQERNVISGHNGAGVLIRGIDSIGNVVAGNYIGTKADGSGGEVGMGNFLAGVRLEDGASDNTIGGIFEGTRNIISDNGPNPGFPCDTCGSGSGVDILDNDTFDSIETSGNIVAGNWIGLDAFGEPLGNYGRGILIQDARDNTIGGTTEAARNVISANIEGDDGSGIIIRGPAAMENVVLGNFIGTDITGMFARGNDCDGVQIYGAANHNTIGGTDPGAGNVISGNFCVGVYISGVGSDDNILQGNFIGVDATGMTALSNDAEGVSISDEASHNTVGGTADGSRNVISGNFSSGILIEDAGTTGNTVLGNYIGLNAAGTEAIANSGYGIGIFNFAANTTIGGTDATARNIISGNEESGIGLCEAEDVLIQGNYIGTDVTGTMALGNGLFGIEAGCESTVTIGGDVAGAGNLISGNADIGILFDFVSDSNIQGNLIGTDVTGTVAMGNGSDGVYLDFVSSFNTIGGATPAARNVISGNRGNGITIVAFSDENYVLGNFIGLDASGLNPLGNLGHGVLIDGHSEDNVIGGTGNEGNTIAFNQGAGVRLPTEEAAQSYVQRNSIFSNTGLGIDVGDEGVTLNDPSNSDCDCDLDGFVNFVVLTSAFIMNDGGGDKLVLTGFARPFDEFDLYIAALDGSGFGEGKTYRATFVEGDSEDAGLEGDAEDLDGEEDQCYGPTVNGLTVGTDCTNRFRFEIPVPAGVNLGTFLTAQTVGSTSEFSNSAAVGDGSVNLPPIVSAGGNVVFVEGSTLERDGSFADPDSTSWTAMVDYGDGTGYQPLSFTIDPTDDSKQLFQLSHLYSQDGFFTVSVVVTDDHFAFGVDSFTVTVQNKPPESADNLLDVEPKCDPPLVGKLACIDEHEFVTIYGEFTDDGPLDTHTVEVDWGDGTASLAVVTQLDPINRSYTATHRYLDDNPSGSQFDIYPIVATITDNSGGSDVSTYGLVFVQVNNVMPSDLTMMASGPLVGGVPTLRENGTTTLSGSFFDPGTQDKHRVDIDWGDGSLHTILNLAPGVTSFSGIPHRYLNDGLYTIRAEVGDDDQPVGDAGQPLVSATTMISVTDVSPSNLRLDLSSDQISENDGVLLSGTFLDRGTLDSHRVVIDWGDGSETTRLDLGPGVTGFFDVFHRYLDDPAIPGGLNVGDFTITVTVTDPSELAAMTSNSTTVTVSNRDPFDDCDGLFIEKLLPFGETEEVTFGEIDEGDRIRIFGCFADDGIRDTHTVEIDWGDGTTSPASITTFVDTDDGLKFGDFTASHTYTDDHPNEDSDFHDIIATVTDDDGGSTDIVGGLVVSNVAPEVTIETDPANSSTESMVYLTSVVVEPGADDVPTLEYSWTATKNGTDIGTSTGTGPNFKSFSFNPASPSQADVFIVTLCVTDDDFGGDCETARIIVLTDGPDTFMPTAIQEPFGFDQVMILGLAGDDLIDVSEWSGRVKIDGGLGTDTMIAGSGEDVLFLGCTGGSSTPENDVGSGGEGNDTSKISATCSTITIDDFDGANTLDFSPTGFGVTFDLDTAQTSMTDVQDVDPLGNAGLHFVNINGVFDTLIGTMNGDTLTGATDSTVLGGGGADQFFAKTGTDNMTVFGGADADIFTTVGTSGEVGSIDFSGDDGADTFINDAGVTVGGTIIVDGGADADVFTNLGSAGEIDFSGDDGADAFTNQAGGSIGEIIVGGGADADVFTNLGSIGEIDFSGDDGADTFTNETGGSIGEIIVSGGADADVFTNLGTAGEIDFSGDDGADTFTNQAGGDVTGSIDVSGGADADVFTNLGSAGEIDFSGDDGADAFTNQAGGTIGEIIVSGGADADVFTNLGTIGEIDFSGDDGADAFVNAGSGSVGGTIIVDGGADADVFVNQGEAGGIDFSGDDGADAFLNTGTVGTGGIIVDGGADADIFENRGDGVGSIDFSGDDGADTFINSGDGVGTIIVDGGADADVFENRGDGNVGSIDFTGDDGADVFVNQGLVGGIDFSGDDGADTFVNTGTGSVGGTIIVDGGADADVFVNQGDAGGIDFSGDDGADAFLNTGTVGTGGIIVDGGADADVFENRGDGIGSIDFSGDDGADTFINSGDGVGTIITSGGADADVFVNTGDAGMIDFSGDDGADVFLITGSGMSELIVTGGADADWFRNDGNSIGSLQFYGGGSPGNPLSGDDGPDVFVNFGSGIGEILVNGGADTDAFQNNGSDIGMIDFSGDDGADVFINNGDNIGSIDFSGDDGADTFTNYGDGVGSIDFSGDGDIDFDTDSNRDVFVNHGAGSIVGGVPVSTIVFTGSFGDDAFQNNGVGWASYIFFGDDGADAFQNNAPGAGNIDFSGDDGADTFENNGPGAGMIDFSGDDGADVFLNDGAGASEIIVSGGADADIFLNTGDGASGIDFSGDDGADVFVNTGDMVSGIDFSGDDGADTFINSGVGVGDIIVTGGADGDTFRNRSTGTGLHDVMFFGGGSPMHPLVGDDGADVFVNQADNISGIDFSGDDGADVFQNNGSGASGIDFSGDDGADTFINTGSGATDIIFSGGADNDTFRNTGDNVRRLTANGDDGADTFINSGAGGSEIIFNGGADGDTLTNNGPMVVDTTFNGGPGDDRFQNNGAGTGTFTMDGDDGADAFENNVPVGTIDFTGDAGADFVINNAAGVGMIKVNGGAGPDWVLNRGNGVGTIDFVGGPDGDLLMNIGNNFLTIVYLGNGGSDTIVQDGTAGAGSSITADTGDDDDVMVERGTAASTTFAGGGGNDRLLVLSTGNISLDGGPGDDTYLFVGAPTAHAKIVESFTGASDTSSDTINFSSLTSGGVTLNLRVTAPQMVNASGLELTLSDANGIENVIGTADADTLLGNDRPNRLDGADYPLGPVGAPAPYNGREQWVLLDFDTETQLGEHEYTPAERDAIEAAIEADYHGPGGVANPWFHVFITQDPSEIPAATFAAGEFVTLFFNRTPSNNRPGGEADELDFRNTDFAASGSIQINGLAGAPNFPAATSENFIGLARKIGAHELGHTLGLRHADAFGPIAFGLHTPPGLASYKPTFPGPSAAFESFDRLIGSPATIGSDRFNDLRDLFFGEREVVKLAFNEIDGAIIEPESSHGDEFTAVPIGLLTLNVPNALTSGINFGKQFIVTARAVVGSIELDVFTNRSQNDWYSFSGRAGELVNIDVYSTGLTRLVGYTQTVDSIVRLYRSTGLGLELVTHFTADAVNDDQFEPNDSSLVDVTLPADSTYFIEVDTFERFGDPRCDADHPESPLNPSNPKNILDSPELAAKFIDACADADTGSYELFIYTFDAANGEPDQLAADSILDTPPPIVTVPNDMTLEATSAAGAIATFTASAESEVDGTITATCNPPSGSTFPLGTTTVTCTATDSVFATASATFDITVLDRTAPTIDPHANVGPIDATSTTGAVVNYTAPAKRDLVDGVGVATCSPATGTLFPIGRTTVNCSAMDAAGNPATNTSFDVFVNDGDGASDPLEDAGPNSGDANNDNVLDSLQSNVASLTTLAGGYATLVSSAPTILTSVRAVANPAPATAPTGVTFPVEFFEFTVKGVAVGGTATVTLTLPQGTSVTSFYKYGPTTANPTNHWYEFLFDGTTGATINGTAITITLQDGGRGDDDLTANGMIVDPSGPSTPTVVSLGSISGLKFLDLNGNGTRETGELTLPGWTIFLDANNDGRLNNSVASQIGTCNATATELCQITDANGAYSFTSLSAGSYRVREVTQTGWLQTTTNPAPITISGATEVTGINFGNRPASFSALMPDPCDPTKTALIVVGNSGPNKISVDPNTNLTANPNPVRIRIENIVNRRTVRTEQFVAMPTGRIFLYGLEGNDFLNVNDDYSIPVHEYGGPGNDFLYGASGPDMLDGGADNDNLHGEAGRDLLIGGLGRDTIDGGIGDDIVIGGRTTHDANDAALCAILKEWNSTHDYMTRIKNLRNGSGGNAMNGSFFLVARTTVLDDGVADDLTGNANRDWFFRRQNGATTDKLVDQVLTGMLAELLDLL